MKIKIQHTQTMGHYESSAKRKVHSTKYPHKKTEKADTRDLTVQLKALEKTKADSPRKSRRLEIIKLRAEIKKIETQNTIQRSMKQRAVYLRKINKIDKPLSKQIKRQGEHAN